MRPLCLAAFLALMLSVSGVSALVHTRDQHIEHMHLARTQPDLHFAAWVEAHSKPYANDAVLYAAKLKTWLENLEYAIQYNARHDSHWIGLNSLADLTSDEYRQHYLGFDNAARLAKQPLLASPFKYADVDEASLPVSIDWRSKGAVSEVKNQAQCGEGLSTETLAAWLIFQ